MFFAVLNQESVSESVKYLLVLPEVAEEQLDRVGNIIRIKFLGRVICQFPDLRPRRLGLRSCLSLIHCVPPEGFQVTDQVELALRVILDLAPQRVLDHRVEPLEESLLEL